MGLYYMTEEKETNGVTVDEFLSGKNKTKYYERVMRDGNVYRFYYDSFRDGEGTNGRIRRTYFFKGIPVFFAQALKNDAKKGFFSENFTVLTYDYAEKIYISDVNLNGLGETNALTVNDLWLEFIRVCDLIGAKKYIKFGANKGEWSEKEIKSDIAKYMKSKAAELDDIAVFNHNGKDEEYPKILYYCFKEIGRKGSGKDDKLIRKVFNIKKVKKGLFAKIKKTVSKAAKTVTKSVSKVANDIVKNPILSVASMATPIGPVVAAAKAGSATKMIASAVTPKAKAYKKKLEMNIKAKAKKLGVGGDIKQITISLIKKKETGQPIPADLEKDVTENQALEKAAEAVNSPELIQEQKELGDRIRLRAARIGLAKGTEPLNEIVQKAVAQMNIQLDDYLAELAGDDAGKLKEDVTEYLLVEKAKQEAAGSGSGNTLLLVGAGVAALVGGYFLFMRK